MKWPTVPRWQRCFPALFAALFFFSAARAFPQAADPRAAEFKKRAAEIAESRREGNEETEEAQERALKILDAIVLEDLNRGTAPDPAAVNRKLASLVSQEPPLGQSYLLLTLAAPPNGPGYYALAANFGVSGPSAVRIYPPSAGGFKLAARIDRYAVPDFFDDYLDLTPVRASDVVFLTVTGRTDELKTGMFMAWRFKNGKLENVWTSELLEHSAYDYQPDGLHLSYCLRADEENPRRCVLFARERHVWDGSAWRVAAREEFPPAK